MQPDFWHQKWAKNEIGFHQSEYHPFLTSHFHKLNLAQGSRIFVPLCGKTHDMHWLLQQGMQIVGVELSDIAVKNFFTEWGVEPDITEQGELTSYQYQNIQIFHGDIFALTASMLGKVDAIYDRAALVALPSEMRQQYTQHLKHSTEACPQLLICFDYDQTALDGPPFSVPETEVISHYGETHEIELLDRFELTGGLKDKVTAYESVYKLG